MFITIINDCRDQNAMGRQASRAASLFSCPVTTVGVQSDIEAAGNLIDMLDASEGREGVILVNVAPRNGRAKKWTNGTPFGYFKYKNTLIVASIDGYTLSLIKKFNLTKEIQLFDIPTVMTKLVEDGKVDTKLGDEIINTQFRSLQFVPRAAKWIWDGLDLPTELLPIEEIQDMPDTIWWVDNFGNCKTTITTKEPEKHTQILTSLKLPQFDRLKDVPDDTTGITPGSSGLEDTRFIEIVQQGGKASNVLKLETGQDIIV